MFCKSNVTQLNGRAKNVNTGKLAPEFMLLIIYLHYVYYPLMSLLKQLPSFGFYTRKETIWS